VSFSLPDQLCWEIVSIETITSVMKCHVLVDNLLCSGNEWYLPPVVFSGLDRECPIAHISTMLSN